jgi:hypothetical protein
MDDFDEVVVNADHDLNRIRDQNPNDVETMYDSIRNLVAFVWSVLFCCVIRQVPQQ